MKFEEAKSAAKEPAQTAVRIPTSGAESDPFPKLATASEMESGMLMSDTESALFQFSLKSLGREAANLSVRVPFVIFFSVSMFRVV